MVNTINCSTDLLEKNKLDLLYHNDTIVMLLYTISSLALFAFKTKRYDGIVTSTWFEQFFICLLE